MVLMASKRANTGARTEKGSRGPVVRRRIIGLDHLRLPGPRSVDRVEGVADMSNTGPVELLRSFPLEEMRQRRQWCGFNIVPQPQGRKPKKIPVVATNASRKASSTDSKTWSTFDEAISGLAKSEYTAVGYALAGDVVGVDLDGEGWVAGDGKLSQEAQAIVDRCGSYAELSISGKGLHILLGGKLPGSGNRNKSAGVEVYATGRFFIVTGRHVAGTPETIIESQPAIDYLLAAYFDAESRPTESAETTETTEVMTSAVSAHSVLSVVSVEEIISQTLPKRPGERNECVFGLARGLKFDAGMGIAPFSELKPIVRQWHDQAFAVIDTKEFDETWSDFVRAWGVARVPLHADVVGWAMGKAKTEPLPPEATSYDSEPVRLLLGLCFQLASLHPEGRFFLSSHVAGEFLEMSADRALRSLAMLCADEVLQRVEPGNARRATRYRWIAAR